jgi:hypothetical protein
MDSLSAPTNTVTHTFFTNFQFECAVQKKKFLTVAKDSILHQLNTFAPELFATSVHSQFTATFVYHHTVRICYTMKVS